MTDEPTTQPDDQPTSPLPPTHVSAEGPRRIRRTSGDRVLGGVAGGLGHYFDVDPVLLRILFVVLTVVGGAGLLLYLALWVFVPSDGAHSEMSSLTRVVLAIAIGVAALFGGLALLGASAFAAATGFGWLVATVVIVIGVLLTIAAFRGGARWLVIPALLLAIPLVLVSTFDIRFDGGIGRRSFQPETRAEIPADGYRLGAGKLTVDLREVDWTPGSRLPLALDLGMGQATVIVPPSVCVDANVHIGAGYAGVLGHATAGPDVDQVVLSRPVTRRPRLSLDAELGMGRLRVVNNPGEGRDRDFDPGRREFFGGPGEDRAPIITKCAEQGSGAS